MEVFLLFRKEDLIINNEFNIKTIIISIKIEIEIAVIFIFGTSINKIITLIKELINVENRAFFDKE